MEYSSNMMHLRTLLCLLLFFAMPGCEKDQQKTQMPSPSARDGVLAATTLLSTIEAQDRPKEGHLSSGNDQPLIVVFSDSGRGVAYVSRNGGKLRVVHNDKAGRDVQIVDQLSISPDGKRIAYSSQIEGKWCMVIDDNVSVLSEEANNPVFSPDSRHIAYLARIGEKYHLIVDDAMGPGRFAFFGKPIFSADSATVLFVEQAERESTHRLIVSDLSLKKYHFIKDNVTQIITNVDKTMIAAVIEDNKKYKVMSFRFAAPATAIQGSLYDAVSSPSFSDDGVALAYVAEKSGKRFLILNGKEELLPAGTVSGAPVIRPDGKAVSVIMKTNDGFFLHQAFVPDSLSTKKYEEATDLVYSRDGGSHAYAARRGNNWFVVVNGKEGPSFDRVVMPMFSPDSKLLIYRARHEGRRFVVVADASGKIIRRHPNYEQVFPVKFTEEGTSVAYGVKDGNMLIWKVEKLQ